MLVLAACGDGRSKDSGQEASPHAAHQQQPASQHDMEGMDGMVMSKSGSVDTTLLSVVAAANKVVLSDQSSVAARRLDTTITLKGVGTVTWDVRRNRRLAARTGGRVEKLFVKYNYQYVTKGQRILELYTPEINTYAAEYLHHLVTPGDETLLVKAREKLLLLGVTRGQIKELERTGSIQNTLSVFSNASGFAVFDAGNTSMPTGMNANTSAAGGEMGAGMTGSTNPAQATFNGAAAAGQLREGMYVNRDQALFSVNDFAAVWGLLSFDEEVQPLLRKGMVVVVKSELLDRPIRSVVSFIEPAFNSASQKFLQLRVNLPNPGLKLKINSLIEGSIDVPLRDQLVIPSGAVFGLGKRNIVWVKTGTTPSGKNMFTARDIQVSLMNENTTVVTAGLREGEEVASNAGYLLDSQSLIEQ